MLLWPFLHGNRTIAITMATRNIKSPPVLAQCASYEIWLKELEIWQLYTSVPEEKQGPAIFLSLDGKAREAVLELDVADLKGKEGVKNIIKKLDTLYKKDKIQVAYDAYDAFERFQRSSDMLMKDFIIEFERLLSKTKSYGTTMSEDILAYRLLKSANLSAREQQLTRATIQDLTYDSMKLQLMKIFGDHTSRDASQSCDIKVESINEVTTFDEEVYYGSSDYTGGARRPWRGGYGRGRGHINRGAHQRGAKNQHQQNVPTRGTAHPIKKGRNPLNEKGQPSKCSICESINHWAYNCPDANTYMCESIQELNVEDTYDEQQVTLFQSNLISENSIKTFVSESFSCAILDSGATSTVAGKVWVECFVDGLPTEKIPRVTYTQSNNSFKFGSGDVFPSLYKVKLPAVIGKKEVSIVTDVIDSDIPMLFSRDSMKKANTKINFKDDTVNMFDVKQKVIITGSGHYAVPLNEGKEILEKLDSGNANIVLHSQAMNGDKKKIAAKLHAQFSHPTPKRLLQLIKSAGLGNDAELVKCIKDVSDDCKICLEYKKPGPRPVVGLPLATKFNEVVAMDLKMIDNKWVLHLIDHVSRYSAASFVSSKKPEEIIKAICRIWIQVFGPPASFLTDNGGEFSNENFKSMCENLSISVKTTAAESPWSNGLCERHNAVLNEIYLRTAAETKSSPEVVLSWAVHAKNSLANVHGFSPYQLAIGYTPHIAGVLNDSIPALENDVVSDFLRDSLSNMSTARQAFMRSESSEKIRRALRHNIRANSNNKFFTGDNVLYKRNDSRKWKGPGTVIGYDSQQILIKHGSTYVRVHPCRVLLNNEAQPCSNEKVSTEKKMSFENEMSDESSNCSQNDSSGEEFSECATEPETSNSRSLGAAVADEPFQKGHVVPVIKKGMIVEYRNDDGSWTSVDIVSRAGKASGKYKSHWNARNLETDDIEEINFDELRDWRVKANETPIETSIAYDLSSIFLSEVNSEVDGAKSRELSNWVDEKVYEEVDDCGQKYISARWVITPKLIEGRWSTKARLVARGYEENSADFRTDSPTCMKETLRFVLTVASSKRWNINSVDIKAAFLQGKEIDREIYLKPPKEANAKGKLWLLRKAVYGLSDASRVWYLRVTEELSKLGVTTSKYDKAVFIWVHEGTLQGIILVHVDDFLYAGSDSFKIKVMDPFKKNFKISNESDQAFKYVGLEIQQNHSGIAVSQRTYIASILPVSVEKCVEDRALNDCEKKSFRGIVGQLSWASSMTRPDISFDCCQLSTVQSNPKISDLKKSNKVLKDLKSDEVELLFIELDLETIELVVYSDASHANLHDGGSQGGFIVFLSDASGKCSPISWGSKRLKRVAKSTLSAETQSAVEALDVAYMLKNVLSEILHESRDIKVTLFTDSKSMFDAVHTTNLMDDKRLRVDIAALREMNNQQEVVFRWLNSKRQVADVMTKKGPSKTLLMKVLQQSLLP